LVVDDEPDIRDSIDVILSLEGYEVATAESGDAAVERVKKMPFDLVITDLRMPGKSGVDTLAELKQLNPGLPVIVLTGYASDRSTSRCRASGGAQIMRKPLRLAELLTMVQGALRGASD
jgi:two-component system response regulator PilR (NtrC family)